MSLVPPHASSVGELLGLGLDTLRARGASRPPATTGPSGVRSVLEVMGFSAQLDDPRHRLLRGNRSYSPGQAAARFVYFLSGSDRAEHIDPYTGPLRGLGPDGISLGGHAHGTRLLHRAFGESLLDRCVATLREAGESNRAVIPFYHPNDVGCGAEEAPCLLAVMPYRRGGVLHMCVQMRAQELLRLFAYDVFELTMLHEYLASTLRLELGTYTHCCFALHIIERETSAEVEADRPADAPRMRPMPPVDPETRPRLLGWERQLRESVVAGHAVRGLLRVRCEAPPYWFDLLAAGCAHALSRRGEADALAQLRDLAEAQDGVLALELESIDAWQRRA